MTKITGDQEIEHSPSKRLRIFYVVEPRRTIGGGVRAAISLASELSGGFGASVVVYGIHVEVPLGDSDSRVKVIRSSTLKPLSLAFVVDLYRALRAYQPTVIHCLGLYTGTLAMIMRPFVGAKVVVTVHRVTKRVRSRLLARGIATWLASQLDYITFLTKYQQKFYRENFGFASQRSVVVPNVVYTEISTRGRDKTSDDFCKLLYVGRLVPSKNLECFIDTVARLVEWGINVRATIVGGGEQEYVDRLERRAGALLREHLCFTGFQPNPHHYYDEADIVLFPTKQEALPNLVVEAFAAGCIIVASSLPQLEEVLNEDNAVVVDGESPENYAQAIIRLIHDSHLRRRLQVGARLTYEKQYAPSVVAEKYLEVHRHPIEI